MRSPTASLREDKRSAKKCKGGKRRFTLLTAHLHAHSPSRLKLQIRKPCEGGRRGNPRKPVSEAEESARAQVDESTKTSRLSQGVEAGGERSAQRVMSLKLPAGSSGELQGSGDPMHHGQRGEGGLSMTPDTWGYHKASNFSRGGREGEAGSVMLTRKLSGSRIA